MTPGTNGFVVTSWGQRIFTPDDDDDDDFYFKDYNMEKGFTILSMCFT
jgi:hypothetical protein